MNKMLYIIGNGFDLAHNMKSSYGDFKEWLCRSECIDYILIMQQFFPSVTDGKYLLWSDFENALELLDVNVVSKWSFEDMLLLETTEGAYSFERQEIFDTCIQSIVSKTFISWVKSIEVAHCKAFHSLETCAFFLTFNYTDTLEEVYGIPSERVLHIPGRAKTDESLVVGHRKLLNSQDYIEDRVDFRQSNIIFSNICDYNELYKPIESIIEHNAAFFESLSSVDRISVIGHSCGCTDMPYFEAIRNSVDDKVKWAFSYHTENDRDRMGNLCRHINVSSSNMSLIFL